MTLPQWRNERFIECVLSEVFVFIKQAFPSPRLVNSATAGLKKGKKLSGGALSPGFKTLVSASLAKISPAWQEQKSHASYARSQTFVIPWAFSAALDPSDFAQGRPSIASAVQ